MKTKIHFFIIFLFAGIYIAQAQIRGEIQFNVKTVKTIKDNGFDRIIGDYSSFTYESGSPELPVLLKSYLIPVDADEVILNRQIVSKQKIEGQYTIYPAQPPTLTSNVASTFVNPNSSIYESETPFPNKSAEIVSDGIYLGYRIITVRLYPFEYLPQRKELYVRTIDFSIDYTLKKSKTEAFVSQSQTLYRYELNKKAAKFRIENPEAADNYDTKVQKVVQGKSVVHNFSTSSNEKAGLRSQAVSVLNEQVPDYIIITCDSLKPAFQPLANWKTKKGILTLIVTTEEINANYSGSDLQEKIRNYLPRSGVVCDSLVSKGLVLCVGHRFRSMSEKVGVFNSNTRNI